MKAGFGVMLIGVAIYMMERVLPGTVTLVLWSLLVFLTGVFLGAFEPLPALAEAGAPARQGLRRARVPLRRAAADRRHVGRRRSAAADSAERATRGSAGGLLAAASSEEALEFRAIETVAALDAALGEARAANQPVMLDFTAEWCVSCKEMEEYTFPDSGGDRRARAVRAVARRRDGKQRR